MVVQPAHHNASSSTSHVIDIIIVQLCNMATNIEGDELQLEIEQVMKQIRKVQVNSDSVEAAIAGRGTYRGYSGEDVFLKNNLRLVQAQKMTQLQQRQRQLVEMKAKRPKSAVPSPPPASPATQFRGERLMGVCVPQTLEHHVRTYRYLGEIFSTAVELDHLCLPLLVLYKSVSTVSPVSIDGAGFGGNR